MSLISIAQRETFHISFVQFDNKGYGVDLLTPESYYAKKPPALNRKLFDPLIFSPHLICIHNSDKGMLDLERIHG